MSYPLRWLGALEGLMWESFQSGAWGMAGPKCPPAQPLAHEEQQPGRNWSPEALRLRERAGPALISRTPALLPPGQAGSLTAAVLNNGWANG